MSTPKINFFIQAGHRGIFTGPCPGPSGKQTIVRVIAPAAPGHGIPPGSRNESGEDPGNTPVCPAGNDPEPEQLCVIPKIPKLQSRIPMVQ